MAAPSVRDLVAILGEHLSPAPGFDAPDTEIDAVHISELADPTGYLSGGELLLTTGMSLASADIDLDEYTHRLRDAGVVAVGLGLGPVFDEIPERLSAAFASGPPLLVVPGPTPFTTVSRAYWSAVAHSGERELIEQLAAQRALVDAASAADPTRAIVRALARAAGGWAALLSYGGDVHHVYPPESAPQAENIVAELPRMRGAGAATLAGSSGRIVLYPVDGGAGRLRYLAVGTRRALDAAHRRTVLMGAALLALATSGGSIGLEVQQEASADIAILLEAGHVSAARTLAAERGLPAVGARACVLAVRSNAGDEIVAAVRRWCPRALGRMLNDEHSWFALPAEHPSTDELQERLRTIDPEFAAVLSVAVVRDSIPGALTQTLAAVPVVPAGTLNCESPPSDMTAGIRRLYEQGTPAHRHAAVAYLRHRGKWEAAARELNVHRNTLRHRIARVTHLLGADLDDPDVAAHLWLSLRHSIDVT